MPMTFEEFLKARNIGPDMGLPDDPLLGADQMQVKREDRRRQFLNFYRHHMEAGDPPAAQDATGQAVNVGDTVTITLKVTGIHLKPGDPDRGTPATCQLNLARIGPDGEELHQFTYGSHLVKKA